MLTGLATAALEELEMRRKIFAGRAQLRRGVQIVIAVTIAFAVFLVVFSRDYIAPYGTPIGQLLLALLLSAYLALLIWMRHMAKGEALPRFLGAAARQGAAS